jgi:pimeloyl-ACP methyl ester carboxylesterase
MQSEPAESHAAPHDAIFIHGAGGNGHLWTDTLRHLAGDRTAVALNLPGHPTGVISCRSVDQYSEAVFTSIEASGTKRPAVCGHSMGGAVALTLALNHPESVSGLVLIGTGAKLGVLPALLSGLEKDPLRVIETDITPMSFHRFDLEIGRKARRALSISNPRVFLNDYLACSKFDVRTRLHELRARTLILCGEDDRMTPPKWSQYLNANITSPHELHFVPEAGHMLPIEKPEVCGRLVQNFLAGLNR